MKHMKHWMSGIVLSGLLLLSAVIQAQPREIEGVKFDATAQVGDSALALNGAGLRVRVFFKVYAAALYVPEKSNNAAALLAQQGPRLVRIAMLRTVDADTFVQSLNEGLKNNLPEAQLAALQPQIDVFNANLKAMGEARKGSLISFEFTPATGTRVLVNGQAKGTAIPGEAFFNAVLRVWLGDKPADADLKKGLLGG